MPRIAMTTSATSVKKKTSSKKTMPTKMINGIEVQPCKCCYMGIKTNGSLAAEKGSLFYPNVVNIQGFYYAQCSNPNCCAYHQHEFIGLKEKNAYENWNDRMMPPKESILD